VHFHATGTGKFWIAMNIIAEYNKKYNIHNILSICEKKSGKTKKIKKLVLFLGVERQKYIQVSITNFDAFFNTKFIGCKGKGMPLSELDKHCDIITATEYTFY